MSADAITAAGGVRAVVRRLHTPEQAADLLQCKPRWLEEQARRRRIPFSMIGGSYRFSDQHLEEIIRIFEERPPGAPTPIAPRRSAQPISSENTPQLKARASRRRPGARRRMDGGDAA